MSVRESKKSKEMTLRWAWTLLVLMLVTTPLWALSAAASQTPEKRIAFAETSSLAVGDVITTLTPASNVTRISKEILSQLEENHYQRLVLDDHFSEKVFERFLEDLDPTRSFFTFSDIKGFSIYQRFMDDMIEDGKLQPAYTIFDSYRHRLAERLIYMVHLVKAGIDQISLQQEESLETNRADAPWPKDLRELNALWKKRLKNDILTLKLAGKSLPDIENTLENRYRSRLHRLSQMDSEDAFLTFTNAWIKAHDPHAQYFSRQMMENFQIRMSLSLEGIGAVLQTESEYTKVVRLLPAGPAAKGGELKPGDRIVAVGQGLRGALTDVIGWRIEDVVDLIRGPKETVVRLETIPNEAADDSIRTIITITRNQVKLEEQAAQKEIKTIRRDNREYRLGVITVPNFYIDFEGRRKGVQGYKSTTRDVRQLLTELKTDGVDGVIVDLRDNGGGALQEATELTGLFIPTGATVQVRDARGRVVPLQDTDPEIAYEGPLVVLVNRLSASASEIFAAAVQDYQRGVIVGGQTFGKGTVQSLQRLREGQLKYTVAKFYRISGDGTQYRGVLPDIAYPALYDKDEIGESALPGALPWDRVRAANYQPWLKLTPLIAELKTRHAKRIQIQPDFVYLTESIAYQNEIDANTRVSLSENTRRKEKQLHQDHRMILENKRRSAKGLPLLTKPDDLEEADPSEEDNLVETADKDPDQADALLVESEQLLVDLVELSGGMVAQR